nr:hypothetical protein [uncultured Gellertiella sp.]
MLIRYERPKSQAARFALKLAKLAFLTCVLALVLHRFGLIITPAMTAVVLMAAAVAGLAVLLALVGLQRLWQVGAQGGVAAARALLLACLPLALVGASAFAYRGSPDVADISTDHQNRPDWLAAPVASQSWLPGRDASAEGLAAERAAYPDLIGRRYEGAMDRVYRAVAKVAVDEHIRILAESGLEGTVVDIEDYPTRKKGRTPKPLPADISAETPAIGPVPRDRPDMAEPAGTPAVDVLLQGEKRSFLLGLPFDVLIRLKEDAETTTVDIRVSARYGPREFGLAADLADSYLKALDAELLGIAGG